MQPAKINYKIYQGSTFQETFRWESETKVYVPIQSIAKSAPCVVTTTSAHNLPVGWRFRVVGAGGMKEINSTGEDYHLSTGFSAQAAELEQIWNDQEAQWIDYREQDAITVAPTIRPWAGMNSTDAYTQIMLYNAPPGKPVPGNMAPVANSAKNAYQTWQTTLASEARIISINQVNSLSYNTYTSGGVVEFNQPIPLTGFAARMQIRESVDSTTVIHEATTQNNQIILDDVNKTIQITLLANVTQNFNFATAVYSLELYNGNNVIPFINGNLTLVQEVTR
jgi:hypothetical protein